MKIIAKDSFNSSDDSQILIMELFSDCLLKNLFKYFTNKVHQVFLSFEIAWNPIKEWIDYQSYWNW